MRHFEGFSLSILNYKNKTLIVIKRPFTLSEDEENDNLET